MAANRTNLVTASLEAARSPPLPAPFRSARLGAARQSVVACR